jgi:hypothetical protein
LRDARWELGAGLGTTVWTRQSVQAVLDDLGYHRRNLSDLMAVRFWVLPFQSLPTLATGLWFDVMTLFDLLYRH